MIRNVIISSLACLFYGINCFGQAPTISYQNPQSLIFNSYVEIIPDRATGAAVTFSTSKLPDGLNLNSATGTIYGIPSTISTATNYVVKASNADGNAFFNISIAVRPQEPYVSYNSVINTFIVGVSIPDPQTNIGKKNRDFTTIAYNVINSPAPDLKPVLTPNNQIPVSYSVSPALPAGLYLNSSTGTIVGTPVSPSSMSDYKITAIYNAYPPSTFDIKIAVVPNPGISSTPATIKFVGQGNIQPSFATGATIPANTGIGVIYTESSSSKYKFLHDIRVEFSVNVASTVDTIKSKSDPLNMNTINNKQDFGNSVLIPLNSGQAFSFNFMGYFTKNSDDKNWYRNQAPSPFWGIISGLNVSLIGANRNWQYDSTYTDKSTNKDITKSKLFKTSLLSLYIGVFHEFIPYDKRPDNSITFGLGYTGRFIAGDISGSSETYYRNKFLGSPKNSYHGVEAILGLRFSDIKAEVHLPFLGRKNNVPGLSGTQPSMLIGFSGGFPIDLNSKH